MFTQTLTKRVLRSSLVDLLTGPHGVDRYTELVTPTWTLGEARAKVVAVTRQTPRSVTLTLEPNQAFTGFRAGQHINLTVEIDGRRRTRSIRRPAPRAPHSSNSPSACTTAVCCPRTCTTAPAPA